MSETSRKIEQTSYLRRSAVVILSAGDVRALTQAHTHTQRERDRETERHSHTHARAHTQTRAALRSAGNRRQTYKVTAGMMSKFCAKIMNSG